MSATTTAPTLSVTLPGNWTRIDFERIASPGYFDELVAGRADDIVEAEAFRDRFVAYAAAAGARATVSGVVLAAVLIDAADDRSMPVVASLTVAYLQQPADAGAPADAAARDDGAEAPAEPVPYTELDLPVGHAVRTERVVERAPDQDGAAELAFAVHYAVPAAEAGWLLALTFTSPMLGMRDALTEMFDRIAHDVRAVR